jgi:flagellar biosynthesis protein FlhG
MVDFFDPRRVQTTITSMTSARTGTIIAVGGGKGGVGKTLVSTNLSLALTDAGQRVLLVDADLGGANAHTVLGLPVPPSSLSDFLERKATLSDISASTPFPNLRFVSGALDDMEAANPQHAQKMRLLRQLTAYDTDCLVLDLGAGTSFNTLDFFLLAHIGIVVVLPEPTSVENAYRFLKAAFFRRLAVIEKAFGIGEIVDEARSNRNKLGIHTPADLMRVVNELNPEAGAQVRAEMQRFVPRLLLNQAMPGTDDDVVAADMASACRRYLGIDLQVIGILPSDDAARIAVRQRRPLRDAASSSPIRVAIDQLAQRVLTLRRQGQP